MHHTLDIFGISYCIMSCYHHCIINRNVLACWCFLSSLNHSCVILSQVNDACKCNGWKNPNPPTAARMELQQQASSLTEACRSCGHSLGKMNAFMLVSVILCTNSFPVAMLLEVFNIGVFEKPLFQRVINHEPSYEVNLRIFAES